MIYIIEDDEMMADCIASYCKSETKIFHNAIDAIQDLDNGLPDLIFLDVLLSGPDGFTFLNELASYPDTLSIPVVIITSLNMSNLDLSNYNVVGILNKDTMVPKEVKDYVKRYSHDCNRSASH